MARSRKRRLFSGLLLLVLAAFLLPSAVNINRFRRQIAQALAAGLRRPVEVGTVRLKLLPLPGLVAKNVVVGEDPAFGAESFARMAELRANVRLRSLWTGRLSFSSLVFVEPSLNLTRQDGTAQSAGASWNVAALLESLPAPAGGIGAARDKAMPPYLEFQDGRINFKEGNRKTVFFFSNVDGAVYYEGERWRLRFRGVPSRTDRTLTGAGEVRLEGEFGPRQSASPAPLVLRVRLVDAFLGDWLTLTSGSDHGIHGKLGLEAQVSGRAEALRFRGRLQIGDLHRWDLLPPERSATLEASFLGVADVPARRLEFTQIRAAPAGQEATLVASGRVWDFWQHPACDFRVRFAGADARHLFAAVQHFSPRFPPRLRVDGRLQGEVRLAGRRDALPGLTAEGQVVVKDLSLGGPGLAPLEAPEADLEFSGSQARLIPVSLPLEDGTRRLTVGLAWDWAAPAPSGADPSSARHVEFTAVGRELGLRTLAPWVAALGWAGLPREGRLSLNTRLEFEGNAGSGPRITGGATVRQLRLAPSWLGGPVVVHTARLDFSGDQVKAGRLVASVGNSMVTGTLRASLAPPVALVAELRVDEADPASLARLFNPANPAVAELEPLAEPSAPPAPARDSVSRLRAEGVVEIHRFHLRSLLLEDLRAVFSVAERRVLLRDAQATLAGGRVRGQAELNFAGPPQYAARAQFAGVSPEPWAAGLMACDLPGQTQSKSSCAISGTLEWAAAGRTAEEIADSLRLRGRFSGRDLTLKNAAWSQALSRTGGSESIRLDSLDAEVLAQNGRARFSRLSLRAPGLELEGSGSVGFDRSLDLDFHDLASPSPRNGSFQLQGTLSGPRRVSPAQIAKAQAQ